MYFLEEKLLVTVTRESIKRWI